MRRFWMMMVTAAAIGIAGSSTSASASEERAAGAGIRLEGGKIRTPYLQRSEAGVLLPLGSQVALQLHYERTALAPLMHADHDDGVMARLRLGF